MIVRHNEYHFITRWRVEGDAAEVYKILSDPLGYARWWKGVHLRTRELKPGDEQGINRLIHLEMRGWLPYTLKWQLRSTEANKPYRFVAESTGDFVGRGTWTFRQEGPCVNINFDWDIQANKPFLRYFSFLLKPLFVANHNWVMKKWEESLKSELVKRWNEKTKIIQVG